MEFRKQSGRFVAGGKQHPLVELVAFGESNRYATCASAVFLRPMQSPKRISEQLASLMLGGVVTHTGTPRRPKLSRSKDR